MKRLVIALTLLCSVAIVAIPAQVSAQTPDSDGGTTRNTCNTANFLGLPTWYRYLDMERVNGRCQVVGPTANVATGEEDDPATPEDESVSQDIDWRKAAGLIGIAVIEILLRLAAIASVGFVMYGGFRYITSQGDPEAAKSARQTIQNSLIGLVIALISTGVVAFVANAITS